jgi:nucleotide-binding universal stress UspA family protein
VTAPIVLGYDGSRSANAALAKVIELAPALGAPVVVVFRDYKERLERLGSHEVTRAVADLESAGVEATPRLVSAKPADALVDVARETAAQLIVVGSEGESPLAGAILGSVVLRLVQRSPLPLLVVPAAGG